MKTRKKNIYPNVPRSVISPLITPNEIPQGLAHARPKKSEKSWEKPKPKPNLSVFPDTWTWFVDEVLPAYVKRTYSPKERWKERPFANEDVRFFFKGIEELSELFTEDRPKGMPSYFQHAKFRSSYLLYFLPFQASKFLALFQLHPQAAQAAVDHGRKTGTLRIVDLGAGPGTASFAFLLWLIGKSGVKKGTPSETVERASETYALPQQIEFHWFDTNPAILKDGLHIMKLVLEEFPELRDRVQVKTYLLPWWKAPTEVKEQPSLIILGHVLNENITPFQKPEMVGFWNKTIQSTGGGGILMVEPAAKKSSQHLSSLRDSFFESELLEDATQIWGPCLHVGKCPLAQGRDWCHFSVPTQIPGHWFKTISVSLGSERQWLKFSYLWLAAHDSPAPEPQADLRRVISDPLTTGPHQKTVLLCEPEQSRRWPLKLHDTVFRGDLLVLPKR